MFANFRDIDGKYLHTTSASISFIMYMINGVGHEINVHFDVTVNCYYGLVTSILI